MSISTDWHIEKDNTEVILDLVTQQCEDAISRGLDKIYCLGDIFDSRKGLEQVVLDCFDRCLDIIYAYGLVLVAIPGNHDKVDYSSSTSYLRQYRHNPAIQYVEDVEVIELTSEIDLFLIPFFSEDLWIEKFKLIKKRKGVKSILGTHVAFSNSINNDGTKVETKINYSLLKVFDLVFSGHYHDQQQPFKNTFHLPSIRQKNFGEKPEKGFTIVYSDLSMELVLANFKPYRTLTVDLKETSLVELDSIVSKFSPQSENLRLEIVGPRELVDSLKVDSLKRVGIEVKKKNESVEASIVSIEEGEEIEEFNSQKIKDLFQVFCEENDINHEEGIKLLQEVL